MTDYYHDKLNWRNELLVIASEEASEIVKVVSKILRYGMQPKDQKVHYIYTHLIHLIVLL